MTTDTTHPTEDRLLWIDIETTGLDPDKDAVLEAETRITDMQATHVYTDLHLIIDPTDYYRTHMDREVRAMHTRNRLLEDTRTGFSQEQAWRLLNAQLKHAAKNATLHPTGSSPQFDIRFLTPRIPNLPAYTSHRQLDISSIRAYLQTANPEALATIMDGLPRTDHRTTHCLDRDMEQYRRMLVWAAGRA